jgi:AP endonuclease-2
LASKGLEPWFKYSDIQPDIRGSDHCPVYADFHETIDQKHADGTIRSVHIRDLLTSDSFKDISNVAAENYEQFSNKQKKLSSFFSAKRKPADNDESESSSTVSESPSSSASKLDSPVESPISRLNVDVPSPAPSMKATIPTNTTSFASSFGNKRKKTTLTKSPSQAQPNQPSLSTFFSLGATKKTPSITQQSKPGPTMTDTAAAEISSKEDEFVDVDLLMKQHEQTVKAGSQWNALFTPRSAPMCNVHKEPCKEFVVNKKGVNHGRRFYSCSR